MIQKIQRGEWPKVLIISGTHGDESGVISSVRKAVDKYNQALKDNLFVPELSPTAVRQGTRMNYEGLDLNRSFKENADSVEVREVMNLLLPYKFDIAVSFHEDPEYKEFYLYDAFGEPLKAKQLFKLQCDIRSLGVDLLNGVDDPVDQDLGAVFVDGYKYFGTETLNPASGFFADWAFSNGIIGRYLNPEIPGRLEQDKKDKLVDLLFQHFLVQK